MAEGFLGERDLLQNPNATLTQPLPPLPSSTSAFAAFAAQSGRPAPGRHGRG